MAAGQDWPSTPVYHDLAGHHQVHQQVNVVVEVEDEELPATASGADTAPDNGGMNLRRRCVDKWRPEHLHRLDTGTAHRRIKAAPDDFDLWQLRHAAIIAAARPRVSPLSGLAREMDSISSIVRSPSPCPGTFANIRLRNWLAPGTEGGWTPDFAQSDSPVTTIYEASAHYGDVGTPLVILAGNEYGSGVLIDTPGEADYYRHGGIMQYVLRQLLDRESLLDQS